MKTWVCGAVLAAAGAVPGMALAGLEVCNDTSAMQTVAVGYQSGEGWASEGWWNISAGDCAVVLGGKLKYRYYYLLAKSEGWSFDDQGFGFCTSPEPFTIEGDADCKARGYADGRFREIDTGKTGDRYSVGLAAFMRENPARLAPEAKPGGFAPGTYGEPYSSGAAVFQDCVFETEAPFCTFHADGTKFFVYDDGRTPSLVIRSLGMYRPGTPIELSGDLVAVYDRTAEIVVREVLPRPYNRWDSTLMRMQGQWYSAGDPATQFTVFGSERHNTYNGVFMGTDYLSMGAFCDGYEGDGILIVTDEESGDTLCYTIEEMSDWSMTLMYLPRANFHEFRKLD